MILAIETSCDETSVAVVTNGTIQSNELYSQIRHHRDYGGVVPELASRWHAETIDGVMKRALSRANVTLSQIQSVAVTVGPGLEGALLVGIIAAQTLGQSLGIPVIPVNHLHGHIYAVNQTANIIYPSLVCLASGGHTMLVMMETPGSFSIVCNTMDDACGEAFDKVARMLGLGYPGGPHVEALAQSGEVTVALPHPVQSRSDAFSFSGLKTAVLEATRASHQPADIAASFQSKVCDILIQKINMALHHVPVKQLILCGGVFSNQMIRSTIMANVSVNDIHIPPVALCTDNAGMIGLAAHAYQTNGRLSPCPIACMTQIGMRYPWDTL